MPKGESPRIGGLFEGYGGLTMGVQSVLGGDLAWYSEIDKGALKILRHHHPDVPNVGDITAVDWSGVEPVDILTGGFPCQDVSHAGKRAGLRPDTRTGLWSQMAYAIDQLRPALVVAENVRGLLSAEAHSDLEPCPWCMGDGEGLSPLRALGAVLGDLAELGYDAVWYGLRAADVGAPHGRFRVFVVAYPRGQAGDVGPGLRADGSAGHGRRQSARDDRAPQRLLATPTRAVSTGGPPQDSRGKRDLRLDLLPTPTGRDHKGRNQRDDETCLTGALLPTPRATDGPKGGPNQSGSSGDLMLPSAVQPARWGDYADAITRWERTLGRPAPAPTMPSAKGNSQLAPAFVEWMMGLPAGHVTDVPGITRNEALKALGNGVVPQQAEAALRFLLSAASIEAVA